jgi:hypothetical protein
MALSANLGTTLRAKQGDVFGYKVAGGVHIYVGATVTVALAGATAGYARPALSNDTGLSQYVVGVARKEANAVGKNNGDLEVLVQRGRWRREKAGAVQSDVGKLACVADDETVRLYDLAAESNIVCGRITEIDGSRVFVDYDMQNARVATSLTQ